MAVLAYPEIDPVLFTIGPVAVRWYGLSYIAGFIIAALVLAWLNRRWQIGLSADDLFTIMIYSLIGVLAGSRIGWVLVYGGSEYLADPLRIVATWEGGMSWHGGFVGVLCAGFMISRRLGVPFTTLADMGAVGAPAGFFFGRIANFINGELWGRTTDVSWAMVFPGAGPVPRHPSQLYEAILEGLVMFVVLVLLARSRRPQGFYIGMFMLMYGSFRSLVEFAREPDASLGFVLGPLTMGQVLSMPLAVIGAWIVWRALRGGSMHTSGSKEVGKGLQDQ